MKPLYRYAGGKVRVLKTYFPFFRRLRPEHCVDYFGGSGTMSLWFHHLYPDAKLYLNEKDSAIYKLFTWLLRCVSSARIHAAFRICTHAIYRFSTSYPAPLLTS